MLFVLRIGRVGIVPLTDTTRPLLDRTPCYVVPDDSVECKECIRIDTPDRMEIVHDGQTMSIVKGTLLQRASVPSDAAWFTVATQGKVTCQDGKLPRVPVVYARCAKAMDWLDNLYRGYVVRFPFKRSLAIRSVAGSGKTTTLIRLAKQFKKDTMSAAGSNRRILYVAFNKQLVMDIRSKLREHDLLGVLVPMTFDALVKQIAEERFAKQNKPFHLVGALTPQSLTQYNSWFCSKPYAMKKGLINQFATFCQTASASHPHDVFPGKQMLAQLWEDTVRGTFLTFDGLRKRAHLEHWMKGVLDEKYARIFVDEAQDFDPIMLDILLNDTSSPKVFVGDPRQQIYEWRGTINAFERLPSDTLVLEFYKTFRIGEPAASTIAKLTQTPMISGIPERPTTLTLNSELDAASDTPYTYLFRTWRCLLTRVQALTEHPTDSFKLWIYDYDRQMPIIERLHTRLLEAGNKRVQTSDFHEDDELPAFLMKLSHEELHTLKTSIEKCRVYNAKQATCRMYTIHSFKGMEDDVIRLAGDVNPTTEANLYYVGLTRGTSAIYADSLDQAKPATQAPAPANPSQAKKRVPLGDQLQSLSPDAKALAEALASFRKDRAANTNKPAYTVFTNKVLLALAEARPADLRNLRAIHGVGEKLVDNIGAELLELVKRHELVQ